MVSYTMLYETFEEFRRDGKKADGPEIVRSRRVFTRLWYHDDRLEEIDQSETIVEQINREQLSPFPNMPEGGAWCPDQARYGASVQPDDHRPYPLYWILARP